MSVARKRASPLWPAPGPISVLPVSGGSGARDMGRGAAAWLRVYRLLALLTQPKYTIGALVLVRRSGGEILLVRQRLRTPSLWSLPGGFKKPHEAAAAAAGRELREETGLALDVRERDLVAQYEQPWAHHLDIVFAVEQEDDARARPRSLEIAEVGWFRPDALPRLTREADLALRHLPAGPG